MNRLPGEYSPDDYYLAAVSADGNAWIIVGRRHGADELAQNMEVAQQLMQRGEQIVLLPAHAGVRTPDALRNGVAWEFKQLRSARNIPRAIEKSLLQKKGQAARFVLHIKQPYTRKALIRGLRKVAANSQPIDFEAVAILFPNNELRTLTRHQIENRDFSALMES